MLDPDSLIDEVGTLAELGEEIPAALFPEYVQKLFETGQTLRAREEIGARMKELDATTGAQVAWICHRGKAYDLACTLFLKHLRGNLSYFKYLNALESAAAKCGRIPELLAAYRGHAAPRSASARPLQVAGLRTRCAENPIEECLSHLRAVVEVAIQVLLRFDDRLQKQPKRRIGVSHPGLCASVPLW